MNAPQELVSRYTAFYMPKKYTATGCVKPLKIAAKILLHSDNLRMGDDELQLAICGELAKLMAQVHAGSAEGVWVTSGALERSAIEEFSRFFVEDFFRGTCLGRRDLLTGNKFALIEHSCEFLIKGMK